MKDRRMGIDEIRDIEKGKIIDASAIDGNIKCFYCHETIEDDGKVGGVSWMFHIDCFDKHEEQIGVGDDNDTNIVLEESELELNVSVHVGVKKDGERII